MISSRHQAWVVSLTLLSLPTWYCQKGHTHKTSIFYLLVSISYLQSTWQSVSPRHSGLCARAFCSSPCTDCAALALDKIQLLKGWGRKVDIPVQMKSAWHNPSAARFPSEGRLLLPTAISVVSTTADSCSSAVAKLMPDCVQLMRGLHSSIRSLSKIILILERGNWVHRRLQLYLGVVKRLITSRISGNLQIKKRTPANEHTLKINSTTQRLCSCLQKSQSCDLRMISTISQKTQNLPPLNRHCLSIERVKQLQTRGAGVTFWKGYQWTDPESPHSTWHSLATGGGIKIVCVWLCENTHNTHSLSLTHHGTGTAVWMGDGQPEGKLQ